MGELFNTIITVPLYNILVALFAIVRDMGVAIVLLTVLVRLLLIKQSVKAEKARLEMQKLQPEMEKVKEKYKDDKEAQSKALMQLYQDKKINPFSSCGATLFQLPFLIGLFIVFREGLTNGFALYEPVKNFLGGLEISHFSFGVLDLTVIPNNGWFLVFPIVAAGVQLIQARMMSAKNTGTIKSGMGAITFILPGITLFFTMSLPVALSLYWITTTIFAISQQAILDNTSLKEEVVEAAHVIEDSNKKK